MLWDAQKLLDAAQYNLAVLHERGAGVPRDIAQAVYWYAEAARRDFAPAATNLALAYLDGRGLPRNLEAAVQTLAVATPADRARLRSALPAARVGPARRAFIYVLPAPKARVCDLRSLCTKVVQFLRFWLFSCARVRAVERPF